MGAPARIRELVERFPHEKDELNEAQVRAAYIDPLFEELGWDVTSKKRSQQAFREVVLEDSIRVEGAKKAPDYGFYLAGARKFFVEAKDPSVDIATRKESAFQLRRYGWSAGLPLSILTDFEEFAIYDCRFEPKENDAATTARTEYFRFDRFDEHWEHIQELFSKEAVQQGSLDALTTEKKRGTQPVDKAFLREIEGWRKALAIEIHCNNPTLDRFELNYAVQVTIDRIVFLRVSEDRGVEEYGRLEELLEGSDVYRKLGNLFKEADERYNSGLFHFSNEKNRGEPDDWTLNLGIRDETLKQVIEGLYPPKSPYQFSVMPVEILGQTYEQFLGSVIRIEDGDTGECSDGVVIEEKPEVKKAGGVYYTPSYIVDYIVEHTVGELVKSKSPKEVAELKIVDPACGSGSFLIGAYDYLLNWHLQWYVDNNPTKHKNAVFEHEYLTDDGIATEWRLTASKKREILLNNVHGVDIDVQAVEVTKLSLLLKVLEGETSETVNSQPSFFRERALPDLGENIKDGNSLIGSDYYGAQQLSLLDKEERRRVNVFDWDSAYGFPKIFSEQQRRSPGFDAVIGNPPWLVAGYYAQNELDYLRATYESATGKFDMYYPFVEQGCRLLSTNGLFGMIVPNKLFHTQAASTLRSLLSHNKWVRRVVDFGSERIFPKATNYSCLLFLQMKPSPEPVYARARVGLSFDAEFKVPWAVLNSEMWNFMDQSTRDLFNSMRQAGEPLESLTFRFGTGVQSGADRILMFDCRETLSLESELLQPAYKGHDVRRYKLSEDPELLIFPYQIEPDRFSLLTEKRLQENFGNIHRLLYKNKEKLSRRVWFNKRAEELSGEWFGMMYLDSRKSFLSPHILTPSLSDRSNFALGDGTLFVTGTAGVTSVIPKDEVKEDILYLIGILNSRLLSFYATNHSPVFSGNYYKFSAPYLRSLPIRRIDFSDSEDAAKHDKIVELVEQMMVLHEELSKAKVPSDRNALQTQISRTDNQIDRLVYELYDLTEDEIEIVKSQTDER